MIRAAYAPLLALLLAPAALAQEPLRWGFAAGAKWRLEVTQTQDMTIEQGGATQQRRKEQRHTLALEVQEALEGGEFRVALTIEQLRVEEKTADGTTTKKVDSSDPAARGTPEVRVVGKAIVCRLTTRGELTAFERFGDEQVPEAQRGLLRQALGDGMLLNLFLGLVSPLPEGPAPPGTRWPSSMHIPGPGGVIELKLENEVTKVDAGATTIAQKGEVSTAANGGMRSEMRQTLVLEAGMIRSSTGTNTMTAEGNGRKVTVTSTVERKRLDPQK